MSEGENGYFYTDELRSPEVEIAYAKPEWFKAYYEGNSIIPQTGEGMVICLLEAALKDQEIDWEEFYRSKLSPEQIERLGTMMSRMHSAKNIHITTESNLHLFAQQGKNNTRTVDTSRLQRLWSAAVGLVFDNVASYMKFVRCRTVDPHDKVEQRATDFFADQRNKDNIELFKVGISAVYTSLQEPKVRELLQQYRDGFMDVEKRKDHKWAAYKGRFEALVINHITSLRDPRLTPKFIGYLVKNLTPDMPPQL
ncbi:MAG TPA: hypothetical protein VLK22_03315 [Candidatus Udaeobacter sp.]|nr:hypothetical protein [Candidatus Udaeobacter sp.]